MKRLQKLALIWMVFSCCNAFADWYLWQRTKTPESVRAAADVRPDAVFYLTAELTVDSAGKWQWHRVHSFDPAPEDTPVVRASARTLQDPRRLAKEIAGMIRSLAVKTIQLDLDVPENQLSLYGDLLQEWRREFPAMQWSVTLLPCHLGRREVEKVLQQVDFWVLQLHGIAAPRRRSEHYALMDPAVVQRSLRQAKRYRKPFCMALPTYAYILQFRTDGSFERLWAEGFPGNGAEEKREIAAPDLPLIGRIIRENPEVPVIWFRLPTALDRWSLSVETIRLLERGIAPEPGIDWEWREENGIRILYCRFQHRIPFRSENVDVPPEIRRRGEWMFLNGASAPGSVYGAVPEVICVPPAPCGKWVKIAILIGKAGEK